MIERRVEHRTPADEIYNRPADLFVANFTGASNLLDGRVLARDGEFGTIEAASGDRLTAWLPAAIRAGEPVKVVVRPENIKLAANGAAEPNRFRARIAAQSYQGTQTVYGLTVLGACLDALELGTHARHLVGSDVDVVLPPALCWAYAVRETAGIEAEPRPHPEVLVD